MKILFFSLLAFSTIAYGVRNQSYECAGVAQIEDGADEISLDISTEKMGLLRKMFDFRYSEELPWFEYYEEHDLSFWIREVSNGTLILSGVIYDGKPNIQVSIDQATHKGSYQETYVKHAIPLDCRSLRK